MADIRADLSQYYAVKAMFERVLGRGAFMSVKDNGTLSSWRANYVKVLRAIGVAADSTVEIADDEWKTEMRSLLSRGVKRLAGAKSIDELHAAAAATLAELAFLQLGFVPRGHYNQKVVPLVARNWKLNAVRSVQYVQSPEQCATQKRLAKLRRTNG